MKTNRFLPFVLTAAAVSCCFLLVADSALAAPAAAGAGGAFSAAGAKFWQLGEELISGLGKGVMLLSGAWAVLAWMGRLGHFSAAITVFVGGIFLSVLPTLVNTFF